MYRAQGAGKGGSCEHSTPRCRTERGPSRPGTSGEGKRNLEAFLEEEVCIRLCKIRDSLGGDGEHTVGWYFFPVALWHCS